MPYKTGEKVWWLKQILERVPPSIWGPPTILSAADKEWKDTLQNIFRIATLRFADMSWVNYFLPDEAMLRLLPVSERQHCVTTYLSNMQGPLSFSDSIWTALIDLPKPWNPELQENVIKRAQLSLLNWSKVQNTHSWREQTSLIAFAKHLPTEFLQRIPPTIVARFKASDHPLHESFVKMVTLLELRVRMHRYFGDA